jgi:hypothetical protein
MSDTDTSELDLKMTLVESKPERPILPFWTPEENPHFISRTELTYARAPLEVALEQRNLSNRLLESLCAGLPEGVFIAGGFMTAIMQGRKDAHDIDLFFTGDAAFEATLDLLLNAQKEDDDLWAWKGYTLSSQTQPAVLKSNLKDLRFVQFVHPKRPPIQLIKLVWYEDPEHVIDSFDLTVAQFATDGRDLIFNPMAPTDLANKRIVLHRMQFPASTLRRLIKYSKKGFFACPGALERIASEIYTTMISHPELNSREFVYID